MRTALALGCMLAVAAPLQAQDLRKLCADRPGLGTPACTVDPGHLQAELGIADWTRDTQPDSRIDTVRIGDLALRYGVGETTELRLGWTAYGHERMRDRMTGEVERAGRVGDVTIGLKQNFSHPDRGGLSIALVPEVTLPVGRQPIGQTTWSASLLAPVDYEISDGIDLQLTPEIDAAANEDSKNRHLAYSAVVGVAFDLTKALSLSLEVQGMRDRDPGGHQTLAFGSASLAVQPNDRMQWDVGAVAGLNHNSPDIELYVGVSRKF